MIEFGFWSTLPRPVVGLAPMDGVTDSVFRQLTKEIGQPAVIFTEFAAVEGIARNAVKLLHHFQYSPNERPIVAQVYGIEPASFRITATIVAALGFDGIDINMGCPAKKVSRRGAGAALINNQPLAAEIIAAVRSGLEDWYNGCQISELPLKEKMISAIKELAEAAEVDVSRTERPTIPVSVKTRVGYDQLQIKEWANFLANQNLAAVTLHGRTLKQMYTGEADWQAIKEGAAIIKAKSESLALGNGDITTLVEAKQRAKEFGLDGVLIGRASIGNPWAFTNQQPTANELKETIIDHAKKHEDVYGSRGFAAFRRFLAAYIKGVKGASKLRTELMQAPDAATVASILNKTNVIVE